MCTPIERKGKGWQIMDDIETIKLIKDEEMYEDVIVEKFLEINDESNKTIITQYILETILLNLLQRSLKGKNSLVNDVPEEVRLI